MSKVMVIMDKPEYCQNCVVGGCKYSNPLWSRDNPSKKGYYCQLLPPEKRQIHEFEYDVEVHISECPLKELQEGFLSV